MPLPQVPDIVEQECSVPPAKIKLVHVKNDEKADKFIKMLKEEVPSAILTTEEGEEGTFEYYINDKIVFSKLHLKTYPNLAELVEIARWANRGKTFMHMYLCSFTEGGEPNMIVADRKNSPLAKRIVMACVIS